MTVSPRARLEQATRDALEPRLASGAELGVQVAVYWQGEPVLDLALGWADVARTRPVTREVRFPVFSCSKGVVATLVHRLVAQGVLGWDWPVARVWPAFAAAGKDHVTVRDVLAHAAGLWEVRSDLTLRDLGDREAFCAWLAARPVDATCMHAYHGLTYGYLLAEIVERAAARSFEELVREEVLGPLGRADHRFRREPDETWPVAELVNAPPTRRVASLDLPVFRAIPLSVAPVARLYNRPEVQAIENPAAGLFTTAETLARHYAALVGSVDGVRLLDEATLAGATARVHAEPDPVLEHAIPKALGWFLGGEDSPLGPWAGTFGHPGAGGSLALADLEHPFAFAFVRNRLSAGAGESDPAAQEVLASIRHILGIGHPF